MWTPQPAWEALKQGLDCPMCANIHLVENVHSFLVAKLPQSFVRLPKNQYMRGWTLVACKRHVNELFELTDQELAAFWHDVATVAKALDTLYTPAKINYAVFGNLCPHLHCHLLVQTYQDDPHKPLNMHEQEIFLTPAEYQQMIKALRKQLFST
ncbi:MAG: HIT family protein [Caldilineaceae bacterium]